jgi:HK97 family phage prohead protease
MTIRLSPVFPLELKRADVDATGIFSGYASTWGGPPDSHGDIIVKGAFEKALRLHKQRKTMPKMLWHHDQTEPVGKWLQLEEDDKGLLVTGKLTLETRRGKEAQALIREGDILDLSIGFVVAKGGWKKVGGIRQIRDVQRLVEISLVALASNQRAVIISSKEKPKSRKAFEHLLRNAAGLSAREAKRAVTAVRNEQDIDRVLDEIQGLRDDIRTR